MKMLPVAILAAIVGIGVFSDAYGAKKPKKSSTEPSTQPADDPAALLAGRCRVSTKLQSFD